MITPNDVATAKLALGAQLAALRRAAGPNQHAFAKLVFTSRSSIANIERGRQVSTRDFWERCDAVLGAGGTLVSSYEKLRELERRQHRQAAGEARPETRTHHRGSPADTTAGTGTGNLSGEAAGAELVLAAHTILSERSRSASAHDGQVAEYGLPTHTHAHVADPRRRELLQGIAMVAVASGLLIGNDRQPSRRLGAGDVARLNAVTSLYRSIDYECGGGMLYEEVARFAESASGLLDQSCTDTLRPSLLAAVAGARQLAGWTAFDAGLHSEAQRHWLSAERAAVRADDPRLTARIRYCQARQFQHLRHNRDALDTLRLARDHLAAGSTPAISAMLLGAEAASLAALGDGRAALTALARASEEFEQVIADREPEWMRFYDRGELLAQYGRVYRDLARTDGKHGPAAVHWVTEAISAFGPKNARSSILNEVGLCSALFLAGLPQDAISVGVLVIEHAGQLTSRRIFDRIVNIRRDLEGHKTNPDVTDFSHALTAIGAPVE